MSDKKKILVVDDEPDVSTYISRILKENGYDVVNASDGNKALEKVKEGKPDLITLDISMPHKSGVKFYRELRENTELKDIPVLIITGVTGFGGKSDDFKKFLETRSQIPPPDGFLAKPIEEKDLLVEIKKLI